MKNIYFVLKEKFQVYMTVKKLQEMYEQSEEKEKLKVSDYLKQFLELKEKSDNFEKYLTSEIQNLEHTIQDFNLDKNDLISIRLSVYKDVLKKFQS